MSTFAELQSRIADDLVRDDLAAQIKNAINDAIDLQSGERYGFNERHYRIMTVADQEYYDLFPPTLLDADGNAISDTSETLQELDDITAITANWPYRLRPRTMQWFNRWQSSTYKGQPYDYTLYNRQLRFFPIPVQAYQLDLYGLAQLAPKPLADDNDTNDWLGPGLQLIRAQAELLLYRDVIRDADGVTIATDALDAAQSSLKRQMGAQAYTGTQRPWSL